MCKPQMVVFVLSFLFCSVLVSGQTIEFSTQGSQVLLEGSEFEPLKGFICAPAARCETPRHDFLWIFSDGTFLNHHPDSTVLHRYRGPSGNTNVVQAFVRSTGLYTDTDDDVPDLLVDPGSSDPGTFPLSPSASPNDEVEPGKYLKLQSNHSTFIPEDGSFLILSLQNPTDRFLSGFIFLFYQPIMEESIPLDSINVQLEPYLTRTGNRIYPNTSYDTYLFYNGYFSDDFFLSDDDIQLQTLQSINSTAFNLGNFHKKVKIWQFGNLPPNTEKHIFIHTKTPVNLLQLAPKTNVGALRLLSAVMVDTSFSTIDLQSNSGAFGSSSLASFSEEDEQRITDISLDTYLQSLLSNSQLVNIDLVDIDEYTPIVAKSHDPNYLLLESCACPAQTDGKTSVLATVHFSNEGSASTSDISVSIDFPEAYDVTGLSNLIDIFPKPADMSAVQVSRDGNKVTWDLNGFRLRPEKDFGVGHPATYGYIKFTILTDETDTDALPPLQACILFDPETSDPVDTVCTIPVIPIKLLDVLVDSTSLEILECGQCAADGPFTNDGNGLPWWLILLLILILGTAAFLILTNL
ncbi:MAG TPA: hypothetical protein PKA00_06635 [Saprospiraceae bacterium]|nr:hypothetical protein [Saprospiraceae bacterium]HMQ82563.1 hypothetical protein [Saprospiraceae bacterium]